MKRLALIISLLLFVSCGTEKHAGGSGMEIPNSVAIVALQSNGNPVAKGKVKIVADSKWFYYKKSGVNVVLDSTETNEKGEFTFVPPTGESVRIEIHSDQENISVPYDTSLSKISLNVNAELKLQWQPNSKVYIAGTSLSTTTDSNGMAYFASVPSLQGIFIGQEEGTSPVLLSNAYIQPGQIVDMGEVVSQVEHLVLDDFEVLSRASKVNPYVGNSYWYTVADKQEGGNSTITPDLGNGQSWVSAVTDSASWNGKSLHIGYQFVLTQDKSSFVILGCSLGKGIRVNAIDSIVYHVKTDGVYSLQDGTTSFFDDSTSQTMDWTRVSFSGEAIRERSASESMGLLQFLLYDSTGSEFHLDDIVIYGDPFELLLSE